MHGCCKIYKKSTFYIKAIFILPKHCLARLIKYHRAIEPLNAVARLQITSKIFSLFDRCNIEGSNMYDKVGVDPNKLKESSITLLTK